MIKNRSRHSRPIMDKIIDAFSPLPAFARQSFTFDRGTEFRGFRALEDGIGARSWFCDPNSPWQKGAVENTNKPIRRFMPGDTDLSNVAQQQLVELAHHLNSLPRKCLGYKTPAEVFMALCVNAADPVPYTRPCCTWRRSPQQVSIGNHAPGQSLAGSSTMPGSSAGSGSLS